jgi:kynureninase
MALSFHSMNRRFGQWRHHHHGSGNVEEEAPCAQLAHRIIPAGDSRQATSYQVTGPSHAQGSGYRNNPGIGVIVRRELQPRLRQPVWGWFGQRDQFGMGQGYDPGSGIGQFMTGTPDVIGTVAAQEGVQLLAEAGIGRLRAKGVALTRYLIGLADAWLAPCGIAVASPRQDARRGAHVTLAHPEAWRISQALTREGVLGDYRTPDRLRLGPAPVFTRFADVWDALDILLRIMADQAYQDLPATRAKVT